MKKILCSFCVVSGLLFSGFGLSKENRIQLQPSTFKGEIIGFSIVDVDRDQVIKKMGLRNNDVVISVNGIKLTSVSNADEAFNELHEKKESKVIIYRNHKHYAFKLKNDEVSK